MILTKNSGHPPAIMAVWIGFKPPNASKIMPIIPTNTDQPMRTNNGGSAPSFMERQVDIASV